MNLRLIFRRIVPVIELAPWAIIRLLTLPFQTHLLPDRDPSHTLSATRQAFHAAAAWLAGEAFRHKSADQVKRQPLSDRRLREAFGLSAPRALRWIAPVGEADRRGQKPRPRFQQSASLPEDPPRRAFQGAPRVSQPGRSGRIPVTGIPGHHPPHRATANA